MILTRTPLRVSLFGGGSDHPEHFMANGGAVLGMAIDKYVYVGVKRMPPGQLHRSGAPLRFRVQYSKVDDCQTVDDVQHPAVRAALRYFAVDEPLEFHVFADLPGRSGLGGSSAFTVGLINALTLHLGIPRSSELLDLAREAISFERFAIGEAVGFQDQIFAAGGGLCEVSFSGMETEVRRLAVPAPRVRELEESLFLVFSGTMRDSHEMAAKQIEAAPRNERALRMLASFATAGRVVLEDESAPLDAIGHMLDCAWKLKRSLHPEITTPEIDALYERGLDCGAIGGKLLGAGGGGFMLFYVSKRFQGDFLHRIGAACERFRVSQSGTQIIINERQS